MFYQGAPDSKEILARLVFIQQNIADLENKKILATNQDNGEKEQEYDLNQIEKQLEQLRNEELSIQKMLSSQTESSANSEKQNEKTSYASLAEELELKIFSFLDESDLLTLLEVSKGKRTLALDEALWRDRQHGEKFVDFNRAKNFMFAVATGNSDAVKNILTQDPQEVAKLLEYSITIQGRKACCFDMAMDLAKHKGHDEIVRQIFKAQILSALLLHSLREYIEKDITDNIPPTIIFSGISEAFNYVGKHKNEHSSDLIIHLYQLLLKNNTKESLIKQINNFDNEQFDFLQKAHLWGLYGLVVFLVDTFQLQLTDELFRDAISSGNLTLVKYVYEKMEQQKVPINQSHAIFHVYIFVPGNIEVAQWLIFDKNMFDQKIFDQEDKYRSENEHRQMILNMLINKNVLNHIEALKDALTKPISTLVVPRTNFDAALATQRTLTTKLNSVIKLQYSIMEKPTNSINTIINHLLSSKEGKQIIQDVTSTEGLNIARNNPDPRLLPAPQVDARELSEATTKLNASILSNLAKSQPAFGVLSSGLYRQRPGLGRFSNLSKNI